MPAETSYKSVYRDFIVGLENNSTLKLLKYDVIIMAPINALYSNHESTNGFMRYLSTFRNGLQYNARKEEAKDLLKKYKEHLVKAKLERNYYNKNTNW